MPELSERIRRNFLWAGLWSVAVVASCICYYNVQNVLGIFVGMFFLAVLLIPAIILVIYFLVAAFKEKPKLPSILGMVLIIALSAFFISRVGIRWGSIARFYLEKRSYESTVTQILFAHNDEERKSICAGKCKVEIGDDGKPEQVIFPWTRVDVLVGWYGIVYDPTDKILKAHRAKQERQNGIGLNLSVKRIFFEAPLLGAEHLSGNWYFCYFWHD